MKSTSKKDYEDVMLLCNYKGVGGAQMNAILLNEEFSRRGLKTRVVFFADREKDFAALDTNVHVLSEAKPTSLMGWVPLVWALTMMVALYRPKVIIGFQPAANVIGSVAALAFRGTKVVATQRNPSEQQSLIGRFFDYVFGTIGVYTANIAVSRGVEETFFRYPAAYRRRLSVVYNATPKLPPSLGNRREFIEQFGMKEGRLKLGCVARLHPQKNLQFAISLLPELPDAELHLAGEGPELNALISQAKVLGVTDRVFFHGSISGELVTRFYLAIDIFLFPSIFEGFGRTLVEALSQGTPVVANDISVAREVAGDAAYYAPLETHAWLQAIEMARIDNNKDKRIARAQLFSIESMVSGYLDAAGLR